jgi:hypothetical protein
VLTVADRTFSLPTGAFGKIATYRRILTDHPYRVYVQGQRVVAMQAVSESALEAAPVPHAPEAASDAAILTSLAAAPEQVWRALGAAAESFAAEDEHARWAGGEQVGTTLVDGVEQPVTQVPYPIYSAATDAVMDALRSLAGVVVFDWGAWGGLQRYAAGKGLDAAPVTDAIRLVTALSRLERFADGTIDDAANNGTIAAIATRLHRWHDTERPT